MGLGSCTIALANLLADWSVPAPSSMARERYTLVEVAILVSDKLYLPIHILN